MICFHSRSVRCVQMVRTQWIHRQALFLSSWVSLMFGSLFDSLWFLWLLTFETLSLLDLQCKAYSPYSSPIQLIEFPLFLNTLRFASNHLKFAKIVIYFEAVIWVFENSRRSSWLNHFRTSTCWTSFSKCPDTPGAPTFSRLATDETLAKNLK